MTTRPTTSAAARLRSRFAVVARTLLFVALVGWTVRAALQRPALAEAEVAFGRRDYRNALRFAMDDLAHHPRSRPSALIAARCLSQLVWADEAEPYYQIAGASAPLSLKDQNVRIEGLIQASRFARAAEVCHEVLAAHPDDPTILRLLATGEWLHRHFVEAPAAAERLVNTPEGRLEGRGLLVTIHHDAAHYEDAVAAAEALLAIDPEVKNYRPGADLFWREYAEDLLRTNRAARARDVLQKVVGPYSDPVLIDLLGTALKDLGDLDGAERAWRDSIRRDPGRLNPWSQIGRLENSRKRFAEAAEALEHAIEIAPSHLDSHYQLSRAYKFLGRTADAKRLADRADEIRRAMPEESTGMGASP